MLNPCYVGLGLRPNITEIVSLLSHWALCKVSLFNVFRSFVHYLLGKEGGRGHWAIFTPVPKVFK